MPLLAIAIGTGVGAVGSYLSGEKAAKASERGSQADIGFQQQGLDYLKETDKVPMQARNAALQALMAEYGLAPPPEPAGPSRVSTGETGPQYDSQGRLVDNSFDPAGPPGALTFDMESPEAAMVNQPMTPASTSPILERAMASPLYSAIMSGRGAGEESILRNASATGNLRGGATISDLAEYNTGLENRATIEAYNQQLQGVQGLAGLSSMAPQIANQYSNIGQTSGQGIIGAAQAKQQGLAGIGQSIGKGVGTYYGLKI